MKAEFKEKIIEEQGKGYFVVVVTRCAQWEEINWLAE